MQRPKQLLLLPLLLLFFLLCLRGGSASSVLRIVVTFDEYIACYVGNFVFSEESSCAAVAKCYGRRLVLNLENCTYDKYSSMQAAESWVRGYIAAYDYAIAMVEEDQVFSLSQLDSDNYTVQSMDENSTVHSMDENQTSTMIGTTATGTDYQWNLDMLDVFALWANLSTYGEQYTVAVLDSGLTEASLAAFDGRVVEGYDFISDAALAMDYDGGRDSNWLDPGDADATFCPGRPSSFHGSKVASVLAANYSGFLGVVPGTYVMPVRVLGRCGSGYASDVADAIVWAAGGVINGMEKAPAYGRKQIISMSFAGRGACPSYMQTAVDLAVSKNVTLFAAAGNDASLMANDHFPANCRGVISVGALNWGGAIASYSSRAADVYMPGGDGEKAVPCLGGNLELDGCIGTSIAVPHAGGLVALQGDDWSAQSTTNAGQVHDNSTGQMVQAAGCPAGQYRMLSASGKYPSSALTGCITTIGGYTYRLKMYSDLGSLIYKAFDGDIATRALQTYTAGYVNGNSVASNPYFGTDSGFRGQWLAIDMGAVFYLASYKIYVKAGDEGMSPRTWRIYAIADPSAWSTTPACCAEGQYGLCDTLGMIGWTTIDTQNSQSSYTSGTQFNTSVNSFGARIIAIQVNQIRETSTLNGAFTLSELELTGYYASCVACNAGTYSAQDSTSCSQCPSGTFSSAGSSACIACAAGTYSSFPGSSNCMLCPAGKYSSLPGSSSCATCPAGSYSLANSTACTPCAAGTYSTTTNAIDISACSSVCLAGTYSPAGSSQCFGCAAGTYSAIDGASNCTGCPAGTFSATPNATSADACQQCPSGYTTLAVGSTNCTNVIPHLVREIASSSSYHTCAIMQNNSLRCWGYNNYGKLGYGDTITRGNAANQMGNNLPAVNLGSGNVYATQVCTGSSFTCALLNTAKVKCWGDGASGVLGSGSTAAIGNLPNQMGDNLAAVDLGDVSTPVNITCGTSTACALFQNGKIKCWGNNGFGQLGRNDTVHIGGAPGHMGNSLSFVYLGYNLTVKEVRCMSQSVCALFTDSRVKCWGYNAYNQIDSTTTNNWGGSATYPVGDTLPFMTTRLGIAGMSSLDSISMTTLHSCAITSSQGIKCWGYNAYYNLGYGDTTTRTSPGGEIAMGAAVKQIAVGGESFSCVLFSAGDVKCWGRNSNGQLGLGDTTTRTTPSGSANVDLGTGITAKRIAVMQNSMCVTTSTDEIKCWGNGANGITAQGNTNNIGDGAGEMGDLLPVLDFGSYNCQPCPAGTFVLQRCVQCQSCAAGRFSNASDAGECTVCPAGTFASSVGMSTCTMCLAGYYAETNGTQSCTACPGGTFSTVNGSPTASDCRPCPAGYYASAGSSNCTSCPAGRYAQNVSSTSCSVCPAGSYANGTGNANCTICPAGSYSSSQGSSACTSCLLGQYAPNAGSTNCSSCPAGSYSTFLGGTNCTLCPAGSYLAVSGGFSASNCTLCPVGTYSLTLGAASNATCTKCPAGSYSTFLGATNCTLCPAGSYSTAAGATSNATCTKCPAGTYSPTPGIDSVSSCISCPAGTYSLSMGATSCTPCPAGHASNATGAASSAACSACGAGEYSPVTGSVNCSKCPYASYANASATQICTPCPSNSSTPSMGSTALANCTPSSQRPTAVQMFPPAAMPAYTTTFSGKLYGNGQYSMTFSATGGGDHDVLLVMDGQDAPSSDSGVATFTPDAYYGSQSTETANAFNGSSIPGSTAIDPSYPGDWIALRMPQRVSYSYLRLQASSALDYRVYGMNAGEPASSWALLQQVAGATYSSDGQLYHFSPTVASNAFFFDTLAVVVGKLSAPSTTLAMGEISFYAAAAQPCPAGQFAQSDATLCLACYPGTYSDSGATQCTSCHAGEYSTAYGTTSSCSLCPAGTWSSQVGADTSAACQDCPAGFYSSAAGGASLASCLPCPAGQHQNRTGQTGCNVCPVGTYSSAGWANCQPCPQGYFAADEGSANACTRCPSGQYQNRTGQTGCELCDPGLFSAMGAPLCAHCEPGTYAPTHGSTNCTLCPPGTYANYQGTAQCTRCALGTFGNATGAISVSEACQPCPPGTFSNATGSTTCQACEGGSYAGSFGASECSLCPKGTATNK